MRPRVVGLVPGAHRKLMLMITLRKYADTDAAELLDLYRQTIRTVNCRDYDAEQIRAWSSEAIDLASWRARFEDRLAYVALLEQQTVGFADLDASGYLDRLFVAADHQRRGIAKTLLLKLIADARAVGIATITTEASITAKPFFERFGFEVLQQQSVHCRGAQLTNYRMRLTIDC